MLLRANVGGRKTVDGITLKVVEAPETGSCLVHSTCNGYSKDFRKDRDAPIHCFSGLVPFFVVD